MIFGGQTTVTVRTANDEFTRRVDQTLDFPVHKFFRRSGSTSCETTLQFGGGHLRMLGRDHNRVDRTGVPVAFDGDFAVGTSQATSPLNRARSACW